MQGMATYEEFADWLQEELHKRGWDQAELSRRSNTTTALISRILSGERLPGAVVARRLARALHLPPEEVFRHAGLLPRVSPQPAGVEELVFLFTAMHEDDRQRLLAVARTFTAMDRD